MSDNTITALRDVLFETLRAVKDKENPMDLERAKVVVDVGQAIINTAKVEVDYMRATGQTSGTGFIPAAQAPEKPALPQGETTHKTGSGTATVKPVTGGRILTHKAS